MIFLAYGVNQNSELVHIDSVLRGRTGLKCPYCGVSLLARKGDIKAPHFAHDGPTCAASTSENAALPAFDKFDLYLPPKVLADLSAFASDGDDETWNYRRLMNHGLIKKGYTGDFELTHKGKIPLGQLSLKLFLEYQQAAFLEKHEELEQEARRQYSARAENPALFQAALTDLRLYRAQWRRLLQSTLYFIQVNHTSTNWGKPFYKIGVTTRTLALRMAEIQQDLWPHLGIVSLEVLDKRPYRGSVEFYFKHRYSRAQQRLGSLAEYFLFEDIKPVLSYDLRRIPDKTLSDFEYDLYHRAGSQVEVELEADAIEAKRRTRIIEGMQRAQAIGRPKGQEDTAAFLAKPSSQAIIHALNEGLSIRDAAKVGASTATIQKVKQAMREAQKLDET